MSADRLPDPRAELEQYMDRIYRYRMTTTSGGNLSIRDEDGGIWITPARTDKGGSSGRTSCSCAPTARGRAASRRRPSSRSIRRSTALAPTSAESSTRTPSPSSPSASSTRCPTRGVFHQARAICGEGGFAPYRLPGSPELGDAVARRPGDGHDCVILENHGVLTAGRDLAEAFRRFETFEFAGKTIVKARLLGRAIRPLSDDDLEARPPATAPARRRSSGPGRRRTRSGELRDVLHDFVRRGYRQRLFISTYGTFSARLDSSSFLITPHHVDRSRRSKPRPRPRRRTAGPRRARTASHASRLHDAIYRRHPDVGAIVNAAPVNVTAFGATGSAPDTRTIPESRLVLRSLGLAPFRLQHEDPDGLAALVSRAEPAVSARERRRARHRRGRARCLRPAGGAGVDRRDARQRTRSR